MTLAVSKDWKVLLSRSTRFAWVAVCLVDYSSLATGRSVLHNSSKNAGHFSRLWYASACRCLQSLRNRKIRQDAEISCAVGQPLEAFITLYSARLT